MRNTLLWTVFLLATVALSGCIDSEGQTVSFSPDPFEAPDALPGFTSSGTVTLANSTGTVQTITAFSVSGGGEEGADSDVFEAVLAEDAELPLDLGPDQSVDFTVVFAPTDLGDYQAVLTASLEITDYVVGGGGCSAGCGRETPDDLISFAAVTLSGTGSEDASFEDCTDREDNDGDGLIDCEDPDCATYPDCIDAEDCDDEVDNDGDGDIDCDDSDCEDDPACSEADEEICDDGIDNDGDGEIDCDDSDCFLDEDCTELRGCTPAGAITCNTALQGNTNTADNNWRSYCAEEEFNGWTGPEDVWAFVAEKEGPVTVSAFAEWDLDLTILEAIQTPEGLACDPDVCIATSWSPPSQVEEATEFFAEEGVVYLIVLDGWKGESGAYSLEVACEREDEFETDCDDGIDNDGDGNVDCEDKDCEDSPDCDPDDSEECQFIDVITCGDQLSTTNDMTGSTNNVEAWCGTSEGDFTGPEVAFIFVPGPQSGEVTVTMNGLTADLDLFVLDATVNGPPPPDCDPSLCLETDFAEGTDEEAVTFVAAPGTPYIFAVDGWDGAVSPFTLSVECSDGPTPVPEQCDDGIDNDGDGLVDCDDLTDCNAFPACDYGDGDCCVDNGDPGCENELGEDCVCALDAFCCETQWDFICADLFEDQCGGTCDGPSPTPEVCSNGADDDGDGLVDCDDADCFGDPSCLVPTSETSCSDGVDNDLDGTVDCDDTDCALDPNCATIPPEVCDNGIDDDGDGLFDCADPDCALDPNCIVLPPEADCDNNIDDDADGLFDCADPDCAADPACNVPGSETNCADGLDNDADGSIDCDDPDCVTDPNCNVIPFELDCFDGLDNDSDGDTDCDDSDCAALPGCTNPAEVDCNNGIDDDVDGLTDCNDSDCALDPNCANGEVSCDNGIDDDGDGDVDCDDSDCSADIACVTPGSCSPIGNLSCGDVIAGSNFMAGSTDQLDEYCGYNPAGWSGPEVSWVFTPSFDGVVEISLSGLTEDLDIQAVVDTGSGCDPNDCEANGWNPPPQPESMDWFAFAGTPYYVVIDGWQGAESSFTMTVTCTPAAESSCTDGVDNDGDGLTDCADIDCLGNSACPEQDCTDGIDNDADAQIDCADPDCFGSPTCVPELNCVDGLDDDLDGAIDCDDSDCASATACLPETSCDDGIDNDADGQVDCLDSDCSSDPVCGLCYPTTQVLGCGDTYFGDNSAGVSVIDDYCGVGAGTFPGPEDYFIIQPAVSADVSISLFGLSDDLDLIALLEDPSGGCLPGNCTAYEPESGTTSEEIEFPASAGSSTFIAVDGFGGATSPYGLAVTCTIGTGPEVCDDGFDNDGDGDEDCFDSDCASDPICNIETDCADGFDNDADGLADCNDVDCYGEPGCPLVLFSSVDDDPLDFIVSPEGNHNSSVDWEQGIPDSSSQGGNGPSAPYEGSSAWCTGCDTVAVSGGRFNSTLVAMPFVFDLAPYSGGDLTLSWFYWQESPTPPFIDLTRLITSVDGGANWVVTWGPNGASTSGWTYVEQDLSSFLGGDLSFGFWYDSLTGFGGANADGVYFDNVELIYTP